MNKGISINLSAIGFDKRYLIYIDGSIVDTTAAAHVVISQTNEVRLIDKDGKKRRIRLSRSPTATPTCFRPSRRRWRTNWTLKGWERNVS